MIAKEFLKDSNLEKVFKSGPPSIETIMIEFAKIKVTEALEIASKSFIMYQTERDKIKNSYDLKSIV